MAVQTNKHKNIWNEYLLKFKQKLSTYLPNIYDTDYCAVIIEPRTHEYLETIIKNIIYFLNEGDSDIKWGLKIYHGDKNKEFVEKITKNWKNTKLQNLNIDWDDSLEYNKLLKTTKFWESLESNNILMFQTDTLLLRHGIDEYLEYNYVGAPWSKEKEGKIIGNGGLSFRKKEKMIDIINKYPNTSITNEDIYFCKYLNIDDIPTYEKCKMFSVEDVVSDNPFGVHQPKVDPKILKKILKGGFDSII